MNSIFWFFTFCLFLSSAYSSEVPCEGNGHKGLWTCVTDQNSDALNVTYDCNLDNATEAKIWLWSSKFPEKMNTLAVQNCDNLTIYAGHSFSLLELDRLKVQLQLTFKHLKIANISNLVFTDSKPSEWKQLVLYQSFGQVYSSTERRKYYGKLYECSLQDVIFENISSADFDSNFLPDCTLRTIKFANLSYIKLDRSFSLSNSSTIQIISSNFSGMVKTFTIANATEVILSNNYFGGKYKEPIFKVEAEKIILTGNEMELLQLSSLRHYSTYLISLTSKTIQITNNIFRHIDGYTLEFKASDLKNNISRCFNFSSNTIYYLDPGVLSNTFQNGQKTFFDDVIIKNNSINCNCANMEWFGSISEQSDQQLRFYKKWSKKENQNKCLHIPNCSIGQVFNNYKELCDDDIDYVCFEAGVNKSRNGYAEFQKLRYNSIVPNNFNNEISQNISSLLQTLIDRIGKNPSDRELSYMNIMHLCLIFITVLLCSLLIYISAVKCLQFSFIKDFVSNWKPKARNQLIENEMENI